MIEQEQYADEGTRVIGRLPHELVPQFAPYRVADRQKERVRRTP